MTPKVVTLPARRKPNRISHSKTDKAYQHRDKDPVLVQVLNLLEESPLSVAEICRSSGVAASTLRAWREGATRRPQNVTIDFVLKAMGYERRIQRILK